MCHTCEMAQREHAEKTVVFPASNRERRHGDAPAPTTRLRRFHADRVTHRGRDHRILASIAIPNLLSAHRKARYSRAASDSKTLVTQAIVYGNDRNKYPTSVAVLRVGGYTNVADVDTWGIPWQLAPSLLSGQAAGANDDVYMYSKGASGTGCTRCRSPQTPD